jgi:hypothetical protein
VGRMFAGLWEESGDRGDDGVQGRSSSYSDRLLLPLAAHDASFPVAAH